MQISASSTKGAVQLKSESDYSTILGPPANVIRKCSKALKWNPTSVPVPLRLRDKAGSFSFEPRNVLAQRENEGRNFEEERFRPTGGDFQGIGIYQSDVVEKDGVIEPLRP